MLTVLRLGYRPLCDCPTLHPATVDHQIVETIWNNRTAMVTYSVPTSATATSIGLMGITADIKAAITSYDLDVANNAGPQP